MITKSDYILFQKCPKLYWNKDKIKLNETELHRVEQGNMVGELARKLYPNGIFEYKKGTPCFETTFTFENLLIKPDILTDDLIEVKSSTKVKEDHLKDIGFQKYVLEKNNIKIKKTIIAHINSKFTKDEPLENFFTFEEVKPIEPELDIITNLKEEPKAIYTTTCSDCPIKDDCVPENTITHLVREKKLAYEMLNQGITSIEQITPKNYKQEIQKQNKIHINKKNIKKFLNELKHPFHYLDFETFGPVYPLYDGTHPYQNIPFQYSLHIEDKHFPFIADHTKDPRKQFIESLKQNIKEEGSIIVYNQAFEKSILRQLAKDFPEYKNFVTKLFPRIIDLANPFKNFDYYNPKLKGKYSIKYVLPALTDISYENLDIQNGESASYKYYELVTGKETNIEKVRKELEEYCKLDTFAEVKIVEKLIELSAK